MPCSSSLIGIMAVKAGLAHYRQLIHIIFFLQKMTHPRTSRSTREEGRPGKEFEAVETSQHLNLEGCWCHISGGDCGALPKNPQIQSPNTSAKTNLAASGFSQGPTVCTSRIHFFSYLMEVAQLRLSFSMWMSQIAHGHIFKGFGVIRN